MANIISAVLIQDVIGGVTIDTNTNEITYDNGTVKYVPIDNDNKDYQDYLAWLANQ